MGDTDKSRRSFIKKASAAGVSAMVFPKLDFTSAVPNPDEADFTGLAKQKTLKITGTFLDEISHDIPHQNWGRPG